MGLQYANLDARTRDFMLRELDDDGTAGRLYGSKYFNDAGVAAYPELVRDALAAGSDSLASALFVGGLVADRCESRTPRGGTTLASVAHTVPQAFAKGEFKRFYLRALRSRLLDEGTGVVEICRARYSASPHATSQKPAN